MSTHLRHIALGLWLLSLWLPTLPTPSIGSTPGTPLPGAYLLAKSVVMALYLPQSIQYPLHLFSLAGNVVFFRELLTLWPRWQGRLRPWPAWLLGALVLSHVHVGWRTLSPEGQVPLPGLLSQPGYFVWLASFGLMTSAACLQACRSSRWRCAPGASPVARLKKRLKPDKSENPSR